MLCAVRLLLRGQETQTNCVTAPGVSAIPSLSGRHQNMMPQCLSPRASVNGLRKFSAQCIVGNVVGKKRSQCTADADKAGFLVKSGRHDGQASAFFVSQQQFTCPSTQLFRYDTRHTMMKNHIPLGERHIDWNKAYGYPKRLERNFNPASTT